VLSQELSDSNLLDQTVSDCGVEANPGNANHKARLLPRCWWHACRRRREWQSGRAL